MRNYHEAFLLTEQIVPWSPPKKTKGKKKGKKERRLEKKKDAHKSC